MKWPFSSPAHRAPRTPPDDEVDHFVKILERRSPRRYSQERLIHYYNYRTIPAYRKPLLSLLEVLSSRPSLQDDQGLGVREIFLKLKDFYDPKDRLALSEAVADSRLRTKLRHLLLCFYGKSAPSGPEVDRFLKDMLF